MLARDPGTSIRIDMSEVAFIDSSAVGALVRASQRRSVQIVNPSRPVCRIMEITDLTQRFGMTDAAG